MLWIVLLTSEEGSFLSGAWSTSALAFGIRGGNIVHPAASAAAVAECGLCIGGCVRWKEHGAMLASQ